MDLSGHSTVAYGHCLILAVVDYIHGFLVSGRVFLVAKPHAVIRSPDSLALRVQSNDRTALGAYQILSSDAHRPTVTRSLTDDLARGDILRSPDALIAVISLSTEQFHANRCCP